MFPPRFLLVLSTQSNLLRALLITRELKTVASAKQTFQVSEVEPGIETFDPAEVWYKWKKVIAACLDIGRTLSREIAGIVIVDETAARVVWQREADEVISHGWIAPVQVPEYEGATIGSYSGTLSDWLVWNLTGGREGNQDGQYGKTRARAPFDQELAIVFVSGGGEKQATSGGLPASGEDGQILAAAEQAWASLTSGDKKYS